jgi:sucrose-6-phosphate hydrolase SacC (GH32 family)
MWAWLATINEKISNRTIMSLPRELSLGADGSLCIRPLRELETLRHDNVNLSDIAVAPPQPSHNAAMKKHLVDLNGDAFEVRVRVSREQATRKRFGLMLFANDEIEGFPIMIRPETGTIRVGTTDAPFAVCDLPEGEDIEIRIYIDKYLVEVFTNDRQAVVGVHEGYCDAQGLYAYTYGAATILQEVDVWRIRPTNEGFIEARENRIWAPAKE